MKTNTKTQKEIENWTIELSRLLQSLEGMELISPKLRMEIEKLCILSVRSVLSKELALAEQRAVLKALQELQAKYEEADQALDDEYGKHNTYHPHYQGILMNEIDKLKKGNHE